VGLWSQFPVQVAALFLSPETNVRYFAQPWIVSKLEKFFGINKNLQLIQNTKIDAVKNFITSVQSNSP